MSSLESSGRTPGISAGRWAFWAFLLLPVLGFVALRIAIAAPLACPLKGDELAYLGVARYLATGSGLVETAGRHAYKLGYSLLITPAFWLDGDPIGGFRAAQVLNALLLSAIYPLAFLLVGRLEPRTSLLERAAVSGCLSCYPAALLYGTTAMSASGFLPTFFLCVVFAERALRGGATVAWLGLASSTVFLYWIHERALGVVAVALVVAAAALVRGSRPRRGPLAFFVAVPLVHLLLGRLEIPGTVWHTRSQALDVLRGTLESPEVFLATFSGQLAYLGVATFGVLVAGWVVVASRRDLRESWDPLFLVFTIGCLAAVFLISVTFNVDRWTEQRLTHWAYGRQNESVLLPALLVGLLALRDPHRSSPPWLLPTAFGVAVAVVGATVAVVAAMWTPLVGPLYSFGATSSPLHVEATGVGTWAAPIPFLLGAVVCAVLARRRWIGAVVALTGLFVVSTAVTYEDSWTRRYAEIEEQREIPRAVRKIEGSGAGPQARNLLYDTSARIFHFHFYNASYYLPDYDFLHLRDGAEGELVLSGRLDFARVRPGARLVLLENFSARATRYHQGLWVLPGPLQEDLIRRGMVLPEAFPGALPAEALRAELERVDGRSEALRFRPGATRLVQIRVRHRGTTPWPSRRGLGTEEHAVRVRVSWAEEPSKGPGEGPARTRWLELPRTLFPGEEEVLRVPLRAIRRGGRGLEPGRYRVTVEIAQDLGDRPPIVGRGRVELASEVVRRKVTG